MTANLKAIVQRVAPQDQVVGRRRTSLQGFTPSGLPQRLFNLNVLDALDGLALALTLALFPTVNIRQVFQLILALLIFVVVVVVVRKGVFEVTIGVVVVVVVVIESGSYGRPG
jgi:hypothetical protein